MYRLCYGLLTSVYRRKRTAPVYIILLKSTYLYEVLARLKLQTSVFLSRPYGLFTARSTWYKFRPNCKYRPAVPKVCSADRLGSATSSYRIRGNIFVMATFNYVYIYIYIYIYITIIPLCCNTKLNVLQSKHNDTFNNVQLATCFGYSNHHQADISVYGHVMFSATVCDHILFIFGEVNSVKQHNYKYMAK